MCSICRNPRCKYRFGVEKWKPPEDDMVTIQIPESDLTMLESIRIYEENNKRMAQAVCGPLALPPASDKSKETATKASK